MTRRTPAHIRAQRRAQARLRELAPIMAAKGYVYRAGQWTAMRKG